MSRKKKSSKGSSPRTQGARRATESAAVAPWRRASVGQRVASARSCCGCSKGIRSMGYRASLGLRWIASRRDKALAGIDVGLKDREDDPLSHELDAAKRHIGELSMEIELLRERSRAAEGRLPLATRRLRRGAKRSPRPPASRTGSSACVASGSVPVRRCTHGRESTQRRAQGTPLGRRGPQPVHSDEEILVAIHADLERSPFQGEGHRKVHARLRILDGLRGLSEADSSDHAGKQVAVPAPRAPGHGEEA